MKINKTKIPRLLTVKYLLAIPVVFAAIMTVRASGVEDVETATAPAVPPTTQQSAGEPLILLNGMVASNEKIKSLETGDIEFVQTIKDSSALAIAEAEGGVVVVIRKKDARKDFPVNQLPAGKQGARVVSSPEMLDNAVWLLDGNIVPENVIAALDPSTIRNISLLRDSTTLGAAKNGVVFVISKEL